MIQLQKKKKWGKKGMDFSSIKGGGGGVRRLMANENCLRQGVRPEVQIQLSCTVLAKIRRITGGAENVTKYLKLFISAK